MGARRKLNELNLLGSLGAAGVVGVLTGSWFAFFLASTLLIAAGISAGDIRPDSKGKQR